VQADQSIELRIPYKAHPQVEATWSHNDERLENGGRYAIDVDDKTVTLRISGCNRADAGEYRILAHNAVGNDSAVIKLTVMDKSEPPVSQQSWNLGLLIIIPKSIQRFPVVENVLDEAAILSWKPPALDGGALVTK
jgi:hypothetical protein